jgi:hypothetical protein
MIVRTLLVAAAVGVAVPLGAAQAQTRQETVLARQSANSLIRVEWQRARSRHTHFGLIERADTADKRPPRWPWVAGGAVLGGVAGGVSYSHWIRHSSDGDFGAPITVVMPSAAEPPSALSSVPSYH